jgi:hypothetical protein
MPARENVAGSITNDELRRLLLQATAVCAEQQLL